MPGVELNVPAPDITLNDFNGKSIFVFDFAGQKKMFMVFNL